MHYNSKTIRQVGKVLYLLVISCLLISKKGIAQTAVSASVVSQTLSRIYGVYDKMRYMSFEIRMDLQTDTLNGKSTHTSQAGKFTVAGENFYHALGDVEYLQADSLAITVYKTAKVMLLDKARTNS